MSEPRPVPVRILDKEYLVACPEDEQQALQQAARHLDARMREIRNAGRIVGVDRIAVMAALNIAHELLQARGSGAELDRILSTRMAELSDQVGQALQRARQLDL